jgi:PAS domain S-box-containing protein
MASKEYDHLYQSLSATSRVLALIVAMTGLVVLAGWFLDSTVLKSLQPGFVSMKANTALGFMFSGLSIWLLGCRRTGTWCPLLRTGAALAVLLAGLLTTLQYVTGWNLGIDELIVRGEPLSPFTISPGRMALDSAIAFMLAGLALLFSGHRSKPFHVAAHLLALFLLLFSTTKLISYAHGVPGHLAIEGSTQMALHTATAFFLAAAGILLARPAQGILPVIINPGPGGYISRRLLPLTLLMPVVLVWLQLWLESPERTVALPGLPLFLIALIMAFLLLVWFISESLNRMEQKRRREEAAAEIRYRRFFELDLTGDYLSTPEGRLLDCNPAFVQILGYDSREEILKRNTADFYPGKGDRSAFLERLRREKVLTHSEITMKRRDGTLIQCVENVVGTFDQLGALQLIQGYLFDITSRKKAEEALQKSEKLLKLSGHLARFGAWEVNLDTNRVTWSDEVAAIHEMPAGYSPLVEEGISYYAPEYRDRIREAFTACARDGIPYDEEMQIITGKGNRVWVRTMGVAEHDSNGRILRVLGSFQDISGIRKIQQELQKARVRAEESDRLKSAFLANMSHEIRTPMNGILGFAQLLKEPGLGGEQQRKYLDIIEKSGMRMLEVINDLMDISRIESGQVEIHESAVDVRDLMGSLYEFFRPLFGGSLKPVELRLTLPEGNLCMLTDEKKLHAVLTNLVRNAMKFTRKGFVEMGCRLAAPPTDIEFFVVDTGAGIPAGKQEAIFERFFQVDDNTHEIREGTGLGLPIAKAFVEMLGGRIWVKSEPGKGAAFFFSLPFRQGEVPSMPPGESGEAATMPAQTREAGSPVHGREASEPGPGHGRLAELKVLVVEDDEPSRYLLGMTLESCCRDILYATTGAMALEQIRTHPDTDLVLMDIKLPGMDGYEATRRIREFNQKVVIIAQTAYAMAGDRQKALEAGCNDYLAKPIRHERLMEVLCRSFSCPDPE